MEKIKNAIKVEWREATKEEKPGDFSYQKIELSDSDLVAIGPNVTREVCERYRYYALEWFSVVKENMVKKVIRNEEFPIFMRENDAELKIVHMPNNPNGMYKYMLFGDRRYPRNIYGEEQLKHAQQLYAEGKAEEPAVMFCIGDHDALNMAGLGYYPLWTPSENVYIDIRVLMKMIEGTNKIEFSDKFKEYINEANH
ncbi:MAG: hypothetical protein IKQ52_09835 [Bacteroidales bacterium]|nr:hypothetical protein [Bacteroidales bacterium]